MIKKVNCLVTLLLLILSVSTVWANADDKLMDLLIQKGVITPEEGASLKQELSREKEKNHFMAVKQKTKFKGDLRLRYDTQRRDEGSGKSDIDRQRWRYRLGIGATMEPTEDTEVGIRLASGNGFQNTSNQSYDEHGRGKEIFIDKAYASWEPVKWFKLIGGKHKNPLITSALVWDSDVNLEGLTEQLNHDLGGVELFANCTQFFMEELDLKATDNGDPMMLGYQVGVTFKPAEETSLTLGATYYDFNNLELIVFDDLGDSTSFQGYNNTHSQQMVFDAMGNLLNEFDAFELGAKFKVGKLLPIPFSIFGTYIKNRDADVKELMAKGVAVLGSDPADLAVYGNDDRDTGYQAGFDIGRKKRKGDLYVQYFYQVLEDFAFPAVFSDSDFHGGGTNNRGHRAKVNYYLKDNIYLQGTFFVTERDEEDKDGQKDEDRAQLDVIIKF